MSTAARTSQTRAAYAMIFFPLAVLATFTLVPTLAGLALSLFQWDGGGWPRWLGAGNFRDLAHDPRFVAALRNSVLYVVLTVPATVAVAFPLAVAVHARWFRGRAVVRTFLFMPAIVSIVAIGFVWRWVLDDHAGLLDWIVGLFGWSSPPNWLHDGWWPMGWIIVVSIWRQVGFCVVLYLAALAAVNETLYEAAEVDGAGRLGVLRHVTWPQVRPMTVFLLVTGVISALQVFDIVYVMTGQNENLRTTVLNIEVFRQFRYGSLGYASAIGAVIFLLTVLATAGQFWLLSGRHRRVAARPIPRTVAPPAEARLRAGPPR